MNTTSPRRFRFKTTFNSLGVDLSYMTLNFFRFEPEIESVQLQQPKFDSKGREIPWYPNGIFSAYLRNVEEVDIEGNIILTTEEILARHKAGNLR